MIPLILPALASAGFQLFQGAKQRKQANDLNQKDFDYMPPELLNNRDLAQQQRLSRRAPGQALADENVRRAQANTLSAGSKMYGKDANKMAAVAGAANASANDAIRRNAVMGEQFSENALGREQNANSQIATQKRKNYDDYWQTKQALINSSNNNFFNGISNVGSLAVAGGFSGAGTDPETAKQMAIGNELGGQIGGAIKKGAKLGFQSGTLLPALQNTFQGPGAMGYDPYTMGYQNNVWGLPGANVPSPYRYIRRR